MMTQQILKRTVQSIFMALYMMNLVSAKADIIGTINPENISIANDQTLSVQLSSSNPNKLSVSGDMITNVICQSEACVVKNDPNDQSGAAYLSVISSGAFTAFITTKAGRHFSLLVTPLNEPGKTYIFTPTDGAPVSATFEKNSDYESLLINLTKSAMTNTLPDGYGFEDVSKMKSLTLKNGLVMKPKRALVGNALSVIEFEIKNNNADMLNMSASDFYSDGVRAISISKNALGHDESTVVYEVISSGQGA